MLPPFKMCRQAQVVKFLRRFFQKADGGVRGGAPRIGVFFLKLFLLRLHGSKEKAAKCDGFIRETVRLLFGDLLIHRKRSPFPAGEGLLAELLTLFQSFCSAFFKKRTECEAEPHGHGLSFFGAFFLWPIASKKKCG